MNSGKLGHTYVHSHDSHDSHDSIGKEEAELVHSGLGKHPRRWTPSWTIFSRPQYRKGPPYQAGGHPYRTIMRCRIRGRDEVVVAVVLGRPKDLMRVH